MVIPFLIGIALAFKCLPVIVKISRLVGSRTLATALFLAGITATLVLSVLLLAEYINNDFNRLRNSFQVVASQNKYKLDATAEKISGYVSKGKVYVRSCFWPDPLKDAALRGACAEAGGTFVDISHLHLDEKNYARSEQEFEHSGVAAHPGDAGMAAIADAIWQAINSGAE